MSSFVLRYEVTGKGAVTIPDVDSDPGTDEEMRDFASEAVWDDARDKQKIAIRITNLDEYLAHCRTLKAKEEP